MKQALFQSWLLLQCRSIPGVRVALARLEQPGAGQSPLIVTNPVNAAIAGELNAMLQLAQRGGSTVIGGTSKTSSENGSGMRLAHPLTRAGKTIGGIAVELKRYDLEQQKTITKLFKWGNAWLNLLLSQQSKTQSNKADVLELLQPVLQAERFQQAVFAAVGVMAQHYAAERVSFGLCQGNKVQPIALSDSAGLSPRSTLAQQLGQAMAEAIEQGGCVNWPDDDAERPYPLHRKLAEQQSDGAISSLILPGMDGNFGVISLEKQTDERFSHAQQTSLMRMAPMLGPILQLKQSQDLSLLSSVKTRIGRGFTTLEKKQRIFRLGLVLTGTLILLVGLFGNSVYRVGGPAELQGAVQRALIAPFDGFVATANARAGERVAAGFVLAELDDRELQLELREREGDRSELDKQYRKALAGLDHAEARIIQAQMAQVEARIDLLQQQLARTRLTAPFAAVVVAGDLSRSLGKPVERGEVLFELAPLDAYRVEVEVADRDIAEIAPGQRGTLLLGALPGEDMSIQVVNVSSATGNDTEPGSFHVEARLNDVSLDLRPGMRGIAKLEVGERRRIWIWTHELVDWLAYHLWAWLP